MSEPGQYILASDPRVEPPIENERAKIEELKQVVNRIQERNLNKHRHAFRATHVKTLGVVKGTLTIKDDLPQHLAQGLFAHPGRKYDLAMRYAVEPSHILPDTQNAPRGVGIKIFNVDGPKMKETNPEKGGWHDVFFNNSPILELKDLDTTLDIFKLREKHFENSVAYQASLLLRSDVMTQMAPGFLPNQHPMSFDMYSQSAYTHGPYVAKYRLSPILPSQLKLSTTKPTNPDELTSMIRAYFTSNPARYSYDIQMLIDPSKQSVEDTQQPWDESQFPWETLGFIDLPVGQDTALDSRRVFWEDEMSLSPFNGLNDHRPLGSVNRLRKEMYSASRGFRESRNARKTKEVLDVGEIPDAEIYV